MEIGMKVLIFMFIISLSALMSCNHDDAQRVTTEKKVEQLSEGPLALKQNMQLLFSKKERKSYTAFKKITDDEIATQLLSCFAKVEWIDAKADMAREPDYKLKIINTDPTISFEPITYALWRTPITKSFEVIMEGHNKYGKLSESDSEIMFAILSSL
ncbi:hypothetical protein FHS15_000591 [Paenibacillus castaneae]|uniref:hypothetical protein n=1 Tax=Paenibacillus castaneae TaxID=474957 RepID=UPI000C9BC4DD|nr:hypothetical protein [Paenibacillus castaneae]NIK75491.1 hypothetical protein [Paenibacillus castaneae]